DRDAASAAPDREDPAQPIDEIREALAAGRIERVMELAEPLHAADVADLLEHLSRDERALYLRIARHVIDPETLTYLDETVREEVMELLGPQELAAAVARLDSDDAVEVLEDLEDEAKQRILDSIPAAERALLEQGLTYPDDSAGRMMQRELVAVPSFWTVGETIDYLRAKDDLPDAFYDLFVVDPTHKPVGTVPLSRAMRARRAVRLADIMETELRSIPVSMDQEAVAHLFRQYGLVSAPVTDEGGRLVGVVTVDDVVHVIDEEAEEDLMKLGGVREDDLYRAAIDTTRARFSWLVVNLLTAILASAVIGVFQGNIEQIVALAVLMPIVASMGGNAGTQTLTVAVRALAMKELTRDNALRFVGKELLVGSFNGILFAALTGAVAWLWFGLPALGLVIAAAMMFNMAVAGLSGTLIPLGLERLGIDPAIASGVFVTTVTDVVGFFAFLGLAGLVLL
ncbi:MAG TPA: magnesium transporter, partial [Dongiaceae bacterium]|nr:magnesium transporter [Dongiaceae bacterium]